MKPLVSVIVPTFNRASFLPKCLNSILKQCLPPFELIVVNDGSTDTTKEILATYKKIIILEQDNCGVSAARNLGICHAQGNYIAFCDSDDSWLPDKLECQMQLFQKNPSAMVCYTDEIWVRNGKRVNPKVKHSKISGDIYEKSLELCIVSPSSVMMKREFFEHVGNFDESLPACEDYDLWLRASLQYHFFFISKPLIVKTGGHQDQLSRKYWGMDRFRVQAILKILQSPLISPQQKQQAHKVLQKKCEILAGGAKKRGKIEEAKYYLQLIKNTKDADK